MKILYLTKDLKGDQGWSRYSLDFVREIKNLGHKVLVLVSEKSDQKEICEELVLSEPLKYLINPLKICLDSYKLKKIVKTFSPDVIHFMAEPYAALLSLIKKDKVKAFITIHGTYSVIPALFQNSLKRKAADIIWRKVYEKADGIAAVSHHTKNYFTAYYPEFKNKIRVVANGVNLDEHKIDLREKPNNRVKRILFVGAVKPRKGVLEAIDAIKYYKDNFSEDFIYDIAGNYEQSSAYYREISEKIKTYRLGSRIFIRGTVNDGELKKYYKNADLFLMLPVNINGEFEGFGLVYLEAAANGAPCIGSKHCGAEEAILDGKTGYAVDSGNPKEIAEKMDLVLNKNAISSKDCVDWAGKNDIKIKSKELEHFYGSGLTAEKINVAASEFPSGKVKLDIGCGKNKKHGFIGIDIDPDSGANIIASALDLPFEDSTVDEINCSHLVEHFSAEDARRFFSEISRILKKGGIAELKIDRDWSKERLLKKDPEHKKRYSAEEIKEMTEKFSQKEIKDKIYFFRWNSPRRKIFVKLVK